MVVFQLVVHVVPHLHLSPGIVLLLKLHARGVGSRQDPQAKDKGKQGNERGRYQIRHHEPMVTDAAGEHGHHLRVLRHLGGEENHRQEHEHGRILVHKIRDKIEVIVKDDGPQRGFLAHEILNFFTDVEDDDDQGQEGDGDEERHQELPDNVPVQFLEPLDSHRRCMSLGTVAFFQARKSPWTMCSRATRTKSK